MSNSPAAQHCPTPRELDDLELLVTGALAPIASFNEPGSPVTLTLPANLVGAEHVELVDPEGLPLARLSLVEEVAQADSLVEVRAEANPLVEERAEANPLVEERAEADSLVEERAEADSLVEERAEANPLVEERAEADSLVEVRAELAKRSSKPPVYEIEPLAHTQFGPFREHYLTPSQAREQFAGRTFVPVTDALTEDQIEQLREMGPVALLALVGHGTPDLSPVGLIRATLAAAQSLDAAVVAVPLAAHGGAEADHTLGIQVVANYAVGDPVLALAESEGTYPDAIQSIIDFDRPPVDEQGLVLFFSGLSGSGKSTLARALMDQILEQGARTVTSLDGDVVRRNLSSGLSFSKADRETNIRRIGWVAAEISRHGGVAVCSPIAPFDETRQLVRAMVKDAGGAFFLVHVATPLEECERRDRKGLYAKARRGEIPEFTGISSPYEEPDDADVRVDTTGRTIDDALSDVIAALRDAGYLDLT